MFMDHDTSAGLALNGNTTRTHAVGPLCVCGSGGVMLMEGTPSMPMHNMHNCPES